MLVLGEGELTFAEFISQYRSHKNSIEAILDKIHGLAYKTVDGSIKINPPRELVKNLDGLPFPAHDLIDITKYSNLLASSTQLANIITSRGCPYQCTFCDMRKTPFRYRSPENIIAEIRCLAERGIKEFYLQDDSFTINRNRVIDFCNLLIQEKINIKYKISSRVDRLDDELLELLKRSGCYRIHFGVESGSQEILNYFGKGITITQIINAFQLAKKHKIDRFAYIMIGAPEETHKQIKETWKLVKKINPEHLHCSICTPMPKTYLYQMLISEGKIKEDYWLDFAKSPDSAFKTRFISAVFTDRELRKMQNSIQKRFYLRPKMVLQELARIRSLKQIFTKANLAIKMIFH
jgi:radical SAM superfamily enzyme YgiQ (UPF0313 family)